MVMKAYITSNICCRSREGAWIEMRNWLIVTDVAEAVAPARERGLKYRFPLLYTSNITSLPRGSVD